MRLNIRRAITASVRTLSSVLVLTAPALADEVIDYRKKVAPILQRHCFDCHGADTEESGLRLDHRNRLLRGGDSGEPAIVPGASAVSHLVELITGKDPERVMPPEGDRLSANDIQIISAWIDAGAKMPPELHGEERLATSHWSFQPVTKPEVPTATGPTVRHEIDAFVNAYLLEAGLDPSQTATPRDLIRRLFMVMHGLPPTPEQMAEWEVRLSSDLPEDENAWHDLVEQVLASPRYGERWARHWLDIVRFGETHGFETNRERPNAWPFRDYVIQSLIDDKPYDQFVREQIAGDAMGADVATGFLVAGPHDLVKSPDPNLTLMQRQDELSDLVNVTGTTFIGLTLGCARCHNHKFDPITQRDFYSIQAVFAGVNHGDRAIPLSATQQQQLAVIDSKIGELRSSLTEFLPRAARKFLIIDDNSIVDAGQRGVRHLGQRSGQGFNPPGADRGFRDDSGSENHSPNLSGGDYSWWQNVPGAEFAAYQPLTKGRYRIWISWGCGHATHTTDAKYVLDTDGDTATTGDQLELASVNQKYFADGSGDVIGRALWSGFRDVGVHDVLPSSVILVRGGQTGSAITTDVMLLEAVDESIEQNGDSIPPRSRSFPALRPAANARLNIEHVAATRAKYVRFRILKTNSSEPCIDELEVWSAEQNIALAAHGTVATSSGNLPGYEIHKLEHINDGRVGNSFSWISNEPGQGWVQLEFPEVEEITRIEWARDRDGRFSDRVAVDYVIESSVDGIAWGTTASSRDRLPFESKPDSTPAYDFTSATADRAVEGREWLSELQQLTNQRDDLSRSEIIYAGTFSQPPATYRLYRGDPLAPREEVRPDILEEIGTLGLEKQTEEQKRRVEFANWLVSPGHPLTSRVIVNRLWQHHFGTGIVGTPSDFGKNGIPPSHPELLDWLAADLTEHGWSLKHIHRQILMSATWRQSSHPREVGLQADAATRLLWRFPPRRLEAEAIRDSILAVTGSIDLTTGGPGFSGFEVELENVRHFFPKTTFEPGDFRRMIYMTKVRQEQESVFGAFDCPDASQVISERSRSTTPLQALNLMNSAFVLQQADLFARRLQSADGPDAQIHLAFQLCFGRAATATDVTEARMFAESHGLSAFCRALLNANEFLFIP